jgi:hypothetical protein
MGQVTQDVTTKNGNGTSTRLWEYHWQGNLLGGVDDKNTLNVAGPITNVTINNNGGNTTVIAGGQGTTFVELNSHSGSGPDGGSCIVTITFTG